MLSQRQPVHPRRSGTHLHRVLPHVVDAVVRGGQQHVHALVHVLAALGETGADDGGDLHKQVQHPVLLKADLPMVEREETRIQVVS
jgi:hypothetical protein